MGSAPSVLSIVRLTSARPSGGRDDVPAKITSSILPPRSVFAPCSPMTHARASTTLDFPDPLGPTTQVIPGSKRSVVADAKDLNPRKVRVFKYTVARSPPRSPDFVAVKRAMPWRVHGTLSGRCGLAFHGAGRGMRQDVGRPTTAENPAWRKVCSGPYNAARCGASEPGRKTKRRPETASSPAATHRDGRHWDHTERCPDLVCWQRREEYDLSGLRKRISG